MKYTPRVQPIIEADFFEDINHIPNIPLEIRRVPVSMQGVCKACNKPFNQHGFIETRVALSESEFAFLRRLATPSPI